MCQPGFYDNLKDAKNMTRDYDDTKDRLKKVMAQWEKEMIVMEEMETSK